MAASKAIQGRGRTVIGGRSGVSAASQTSAQDLVSPGRTVRRTGLPSRHEALPLGLIVALAAALRFGTIGAQSVWLDEAATIRVVSRGFGGMLSQVAHGEITPPLYYTAAWLWTRIFGHSVFAFRSLSAAAGTATVVLMYVAGRRYSGRVGLWAAALTAVSPMMVYYSQEARSYELFVALSLGAFIAWQWAMEEGRGRALAAWAGLSALALATHYFAVFVWLPEAAMLVARWGWRRLAAPLIVFGAAGTALLPVLLDQTASGRSSWIAALPLVRRVAQTVKEFVIGPYGPEGIAATAVGAATSGLAVLSLVRSSPSVSRAALGRVAIVGIAGLALPLLLAVTGIDDVVDPRNVLAAWAPLALLVAAGACMGRRPFGALLAGALCAASLAVAIGASALPAYQRDDWRDAAASLGPPVAGGRVIVSGRDGWSPLQIYLPRLLPVSPVTAALRTSEVDFVFLRSPHTGAWSPGEDSLSAPVPPSAPSGALPGFRLRTVSRTPAYASYEFVSPTTRSVDPGLLRRLEGERQAELSFEP